AQEKGKVKGAIRTDFILSAEIIVISLGTVAGKTFPVQLGVLSGIAVLMTVGVYGLVAGIVKLDDAGLYLARATGGAARAVGTAILRAAPWLMKGLAVAGTAAMFLVGGGILVHGFHALSAWVDDQALDAAAVPGIGVVLGALTPMLLNALAGTVAGAVVVGCVAAYRRRRGGDPPPAPGPAYAPAAPRQSSASSGGTRPARPSAGPRGRVGSGASSQDRRCGPSHAYAATALSLRLARAQRAGRCGASQATPRPRARATWSRSAATSRRPRFTPCPASGWTACAASPTTSTRPAYWRSLSWR